MQDLKGRVVVIVGASSGVGRAAAMAFAERGARLVLAARNEAALAEVAAACRAEGAPAIGVRIDVTRREEVQRLAAAAQDFAGRIDVWINNVGVGAMGSFLDTPVEAHERVIATNLLAHLYGAHAVLPCFLRQGRGILITTNSIGAFAPAPYAVAYSASKFGLRGFTEALRGELTASPDIHVCDLFPSFLDTPGLRHGANYTGRRMKPPPMVVDPHRVAAAMVRLSRRPRPVTFIGEPTAAARTAHLVAPRLMARSAARLVEAYLDRAAPAGHSDGNLFEPSSSWTGIEGAWRRPGQRAVVVAAAAGLAGLLLARLASAGRNGRSVEAF